MATFEHVEKLRERANVSYDEAKAALDACGDDLLEAMIYLERQGKVVPPAGGGAYSTRAQNLTVVNGAYSGGQGGQGESFSQLMKRFFRWCGEVLNKGNTNSFQVWRKENMVITVPVTVLVLLLIFCFCVTIPLLVVGLFFGCRYRFSGRDLENTGVNDVMDTAANTADNLKQEVKGYHNRGEHSSGDSERK